MRRRFWTCCAMLALVWIGAAARADVWDVGFATDNALDSSGPRNELVHGLNQVHDMAAQQGGTVEDVDWYPFRHGCEASYEILLDGLTGDVSNGTATTPALETFLSDGTTVIGVGQPVSSLGVARRVTYQCTGGGYDDYGFARVSHPSCGLSCTSTDQYRIHFRETTAFVPRFNNSATQVSVLILQNPTSENVDAQVAAFDFVGGRIASTGVSLSPNQVTTLNLATAFGGALAGKSGALRIINDAPYGALAGKAVAVEPATGFTFDTALSYKPY